MLSASIPDNLQAAAHILVFEYTSFSTSLRANIAGVPGSMATAIQNESQYIDAFLKLTLRPASASDLFPLLISLTPQQRQDFVELADSNHVVIRAFEVLNRVA